jgi:hypothetical protein
MPLLPPRLAVGLLLALAGCQEQAPPPPLEVLDWSGRDQVCLALDQPLRVHFSAPLRAPLRPGSVLIVDEGVHEVPGLLVRADGPYLQILPQLPIRPDLLDGSLAAGQSFAIRLRGLPSLAAVQGEGGEVLVGDLDLRFRTCPATDAAALIGLGQPGAPLELTPGQLAAGLLNFRPATEVLLRFSSGIDPRSLGEGARLLPTEGGDPRPVKLTLRRNALDEAVLHLDLGDWRGWGVLELPEGLEGLGGRPLAPELRRVRVHR